MKNHRYLRNAPLIKIVAALILTAFMLPVLAGLLGMDLGTAGVACAASLTLLDVAKRTGNDATIGVIEEVTTYAPEVRSFPARPKAGTSYKLFQRTGLPSGSFRDANAGTALVKSSSAQKLAEMFFFDCQLQLDEAVQKADTGELGDLLADETVAAVEGSMITLGNQVWYGANATDKGFDGLKNFLTDEVDAAGSGGAYSSAYLVWLDPSYKGVFFDVGNNGDMSFGEWQKQQITDPNDATKRYMAWVNNMSFYLGLNIGSDKSVWRAKKLTTAAPLTDAIGAAVLAKVPMTRRANLRWFMNPTAALQLQKSRSSIGNQKSNDKGDAWAPQPTELSGVPIILTDSLSATETA